MLFFKQGWILALFSTFVDGSENEVTGAPDATPPAISRPGPRPPPPPPKKKRDKLLIQQDDALVGHTTPYPGDTAESILVELGWEKTRSFKESTRLLEKLVRLPILDFVGLVVDQVHSSLFRRVERKWDGFIVANQARMAKARDDEQKRKWSSLSEALDLQLNIIRGISLRLDNLVSSLRVGISRILKNQRVPGGGDWAIPLLDALRLPSLYSPSEATRELGLANPQLAIDVTKFDLTGFFQLVVPHSLFELMILDVAFADLRLDVMYSTFFEILDYDDDSKKFRACENLPIFQEESSVTAKADLLTMIYSYIRFRIDFLLEQIRAEWQLSSSSLPSLVNPALDVTICAPLEADDSINSVLEADRDSIDTPTGSRDVGMMSAYGALSRSAQLGPQPASLSAYNRRELYPEFSRIKTQLLPTHRFVKGPDTTTFAPSGI